jgi:hypothetical protein
LRLAWPNQYREPWSPLNDPFLEKYCHCSLSRLSPVAFGLRQTDNFAPASCHARQRAAMDQDQRRDAIVGKFTTHLSLEPAELDPELARYEANGFYLRAWMWQASHCRKVWCARHGIPDSGVHALNAFVYPSKKYDAPIFLILFVVMRHKVMCHFNVNAPLDSDAYKAKWVGPLTDTLRTYPTFEAKGQYPSWLLPYRQPCSVRGMHELDQLDDLTHCMLDYLDVYLPTLTASVPVSDSDTLSRIDAFHERFCDDIRTKDPGLRIMANYMDKRLLDRFFFEVFT